jgi:dTDP-glucose pyrophosphorylase
LNSYRKHLILTGIPIKVALIQLENLASDAILFVVDAEDHLIGSLTDGDVRRGLIKGVSIDQPINDIIQGFPRFLKKGDRNIQKVIEYRENLYRIIPILDKSNRVVNVINFREIRSYLPVDAVIMAGGRGQRLSPLTDTIPKPLLKIGNKPIIEYNLQRLVLYGIDDFWITINYLGEQIENYFGNDAKRDISVQYIKETEPLGTLGSVSKIRNFEHDYVLITNSDLLTNIDYEHFFLQFLEHKADMAVVTIPYSVKVPYAVLETSNEHIVSFKEKPTYTYYSNGGIYLVKREVLDLIPANTRYDTTDLMEELISKGKKVFSYPLLGYWLDIGNPEDFEKAKADIDNIKF